MNEIFYQKIVKLYDKEYVFTEVNEKHFGSVKRTFGTAMKKIGIKNFHSHDLRHIFGSHLVMQGVDLHTSPTDTGA